MRKGKSSSEGQNEKVVLIEGSFIQAAFINEMGKFENVDSQRSKLSPLWIEETFKAKPFKLGLDLQGGMNLLLEADFEKLSEKIKEQYPPEYISKLNENIKNEKDEDKKEGFVQERDRILSLLDLKEDKRKEYVEGALEIIRSRIDKTGVSEPLIRLQGQDKIEISLPGVASPEQAKKLIKSTAKVSYHLVEPESSSYGSKAAAFFKDYLELRSEKRRTAFIKEIEKKIKLPTEYGIYVFWSKDFQGCSIQAKTFLFHGH